MSAALQSLMRDIPRAQPRAAGTGSVVNFVLIGAAGAGAFIVLSTLAIWLNPGVPSWMVSAACYAAIILPVYLMHRRFSFGSDASHWQALPRYIAVQGMALALAALFSLVVHGMLVLPTLFASMLVIVLTSGVNYVVLRSWAFAHSQVRNAVTA